MAEQNFLIFCGEGQENILRLYEKSLLKSGFYFLSYGMGRNENEGGGLIYTEYNEIR